MGIEPLNRIRVIRSISHSHILKEHNGRNRPVVNVPLELPFLLDDFDFSGLQSIQRIRAPVQLDFMNDETLVRGIEVEGKARFILHSVLIDEVFDDAMEFLL